jgi:phytoene dehydrogenase-like protein
VLARSVEETANLLGTDAKTYIKLILPVIQSWPSIAQDALSPLKIPRHPLLMAKFGASAMLSAQTVAKRFNEKKARGLWAGMAAHSIQPLSNATTAAIGLVLATVGHIHGWPMPKGGSQAIAKAMADYFISIGGKIEVNTKVSSLQQLPSSKAVFFDLTPRQLLEIAGHRFSSLYKWQLNKYRYGMGVFKVDWALDGPIPWKASACGKAGTVHIGNTFEEIAASEQASSSGQHPGKPFVLLAQQSLFDASRAPAGKHTAWAYCHVPNGSTVDRTEPIEKQIERFAPGFRDRILAKHTINTEQLQEYNANYIGGDINGGIIDIGQLFTRPALRWSPYRTSAKGIYLCSSSTPPGGGVHGMCGYNAAKRALKDIFKN